MAWDDEIDQIVGKVADVPDDDDVRTKRGELIDAGDRLGAGTARVQRYEASVALNDDGGQLGMGTRGPKGGRGLFIVRADDGLLTRVPPEEWTAAEVVDAHAAMPDLLAALNTEASKRKPVGRGQAGV